MSSSAKPKCWRDTPHATITWGGGAREVRTGLWRSMRPTLDADKCVSCLRCWLQCPDDSILTDEDAKVRGIDLFFCKGCGVCERLCPTRAISMHPEADFEDISAEGRNPGEAGDYIGS